ncbi:MAG: LacI family DNA-binding transcriptional regulator [Spirochaetia bacterium]|jgi:DNA-binding LacI/PurR family transcriptional regulator
MIKNPKRAEVARLAGVSESTVSRSLSDSPHISSESKQRVRDAAQRLGYVPSRQAALFARRRTSTVGFVVPHYATFPPFSRAYFPALLDGAVLGAEELGYSVAIVLHKVEAATSDYYGLIKSKTYDGLLFSVTQADFSPFHYLKENNVPFVMINNYCDGLDSVDARPEPGMRKAFAHAADLGHRRIGYITGDMAYRNAMDRLEVFKRLAEEHNMITSIAEGTFSKTSGLQGTAWLLQQRNPPTLIMTSSDRAALGVLQYCAGQGLRVPEDVSVIGYDNLHPAQDVHPSLSTVDNPVSRAGWVAAQLLIGIINGTVESPVQRWLDTDFVPRESTAAVAAGKGS